jgi:aryl-alcohol dehydrogenase-like predicted oxidoreductase
VLFTAWKSDELVGEVIKQAGKRDEIIVAIKGAQIKMY